MFRKDADNKLSHEKLCYGRDLLHPRVPVFDHTVDYQKYQKHSFCTSGTGWSHCKKSMRKTDFNVYGVGVVLYFQFLKYLMVIMFLLSVLSLPSMLIFYHGQQVYEEDVKAELAEI